MITLLGVAIKRKSLYDSILNFSNGEKVQFNNKKFKTQEKIDNQAYTVISTGGELIETGHQPQQVGQFETPE